jgi:hypothetical protein
MPFTLAHPAAILPLGRALRGRAVASALVIGSMVPDVPNLFPALATRDAAHSFYGLFWFCLPTGLLAYVVFHLALARPLAGLLPRDIRARLAPFLEGPGRFAARSLGFALASLLLGAVTHVIWDSFTHPGAPAVNLFQILREPWLRIGREDIVGHRVLQVLSTAFGLYALGVWGWRWWWAGAPGAVPASSVSIDPLRAATLGAMAGIAFGFALHASLGRSFSPSFDGLMATLHNGAIAGLEGMLLAILAFSVAWHAVSLLERLRSRSAGGPR